MPRLDWRKYTLGDLECYSTDLIDKNPIFLYAIITRDDKNKDKWVCDIRCSDEKVTLKGKFPSPQHAKDAVGNWFKEYVYSLLTK